MNRPATLAATALGLAVTALLVRGHHDVGYVRDEGIYFHASRAYADWAARVLAQPSLLADRPLRDRAFSVNREHPALMKLAGGLSARLFSEPGPPGQPDQPRAPAGSLPLLPEGAAMRLPAQLLAGLGAALLFLAGWGLARPRRATDPAPTRSEAPAPPALSRGPAAAPGVTLPADPVSSDLSQWTESALPSGIVHSAEPAPPALSPGPAAASPSGIAHSAAPVPSDPSPGTVAASPSGVAGPAAPVPPALSPEPAATHSATPVPPDLSFGPAAAHSAEPVPPALSFGPAAAHSAEPVPPALSSGTTASSGPLSAAHDHSDLSIPPAVPALLAALAFIGLPHVWYHAGLHAFDVPVAVLTLAVVLCYRRALASARWSLLLGPLLGVAISIKHNALFIPLLLGVHYLAGLALARRRPTLGQLLPLPFLSMALLAPPTVLALWPWLWSDPLARLAEYFEFHRLHAYYNTEYFSINYNQPPLPWSYPFVLTWATVPSALLLLAAIGLVLAVRRDLTDRPPDTAPPPSWTAPLRGHPTRDGLLWLLFALFPLLLISLPTIPIFGGTKHWLTAYPFLALAAAHAWVVLWRTLAPRGRARLLPAALLPLLLVPTLWSTIHAHPYGISQYAPLVGGARGAADLGLMRGFWGGSVLPLLADMSERPAPLHVHDMHELARQQYEREGRWPAGVTSVPLTRARAGLLFHERHMLSNEIDLWNHLGTTSPSAVLTLDDVPLTSLYRAR